MEQKQHQLPSHRCLLKGRNTNSLQIDSRWYITAPKEGRPETPNPPDRSDLRGVGDMVRLLETAPRHPNTYWANILTPKIYLWTPNLRMYDWMSIWRIIPVSKSLVITSHEIRPCRRGTTQSLWDLRSPWLLTTYKSWDDPPSSRGPWKPWPRCDFCSDELRAFGRWKDR